ncbi:uncharacterized protein ppp1r3ab [Hippocampus zosterae]|uniref:uncharacterized protein ppp1r3ab n=1 Tax=Hippocampus zosterae TaxID=109293 RepID=UPI00223E11C5|nr:uncharacterized protein ppp1r3ab [Hippocampus zosterae]
MDSEVQARLSRACRLLSPGPDMDEDEGEVVISIRPKSSPLPRRRSSLSDEDSEPELPPCASRRVSFADAKGLSLVQVKEFDLWDVPNPPGMERLDDEGLSTEEYRLSPLTFQSPLSPEDLLVRVQEQKIELESLELIPGTSTLKGLICVLNMSFQKAVYVRTTLDCWASHFDLLTEYIPESGNAQTDRFSFKLTLVPPFREQGSRVDFCLRYETPVGTFWANNNHRNYVLFCHQRAKEPREKPQTRTAQKKSCLKTLRADSQNDTAETPSQENLSADSAPNGETVDSEKWKVAQAPHRSDDDGNNLQAENRWNCSRRNQRKAARMARVRDYFSGTDDVLDEKSDATRPEDEGKDEIPVAVQENMQRWCEEETKFEDSRGIVEKTFGEMPNQQDEAQARHKAETREDASLTLFFQGEASADMSNDEPPPTERRRPFVSGAEETNESCPNKSNGFPFETAGTLLYCQMLGTEENNWTRPQQTEGEDQPTSLKVQANVIGKKNHQADPKPANSSESMMKSTDLEQEHVMENATQGCFDGNWNVPLPENGMWNGAEDASEWKLSAQRNVNITPFHKDVNLPSGVSHAIQNPVSDNVDQSVSLGRTDWSETEESDAESVENTPSREAILEDVNENATKQRLDDAARNGTKMSTNLMERNTEMAPPSGGSQTIQSQSEPVSDGFVSADRSDAQEAVTKSDDRQNYEPLQENVIENSIEERVDTNLNVPEDTLHRANCVPGRTFSDQTNISKSHSEPVSDGEDGEAIADHTDGSYLQSSVVGSTSISPSESLNHTEVFGKAVTDEPETHDPATARTPQIFLGPRGGPCCTGGDERHGFRDDEALTCKDDSQGVSFLEDEANISQTVNLDPFGAAETDEAQRWEAKVEEEEAKVFQEVSEEIQHCPPMEKPDDLKEELDIATPGAAEPDDVENERSKMIFDIGEDAGETEEHVADMRKGKLEVEMWQEVVRDEDGAHIELVDKAPAVDLGNQEQKIPADDVTRSELDLNNLMDSSPSRLREADAAVEEPTQQNPDGKTATGDESEDGPCVFAEQPEGDGASAESDSDDEVELYMHCLRAVQTKDQGAEASFGLSKRPSLSTSKPLSSPMPSISESADEEHVGCRQQTENAARSQPSEPESAGTNVARRETCSYRSVSKMLLYVALFAVFAVTAYYYDFLACFGLYLISVVWLLCQGEKRPMKDNSIG